MRKGNGKLDKYCPRCQDVFLKHLLEDHEDTYLDGEVQRWGGTINGSGWNTAISQDYLKNLFEYDVCNDIVKVDIEKALAYAKKTKDRKSESYFEELLQVGYAYVSIDGYNTESTICAFLRSTLSAIVFDSKGKQFFKNLSLEQRIEIEHRVFSVIILEEISRDQMFDLFKRLQRGNPPNAQEARQATGSKLSKTVRNISNSISAPKQGRKGMLKEAYYPTGNDFYNKFVWPNQADRDCRKHEQLTAQLALKLHSNFNKDLSKVKLDDFYEDVNSLGDDVEKNLKVIFDESNKVGGIDKDVVRFDKGQAQNFFDFIHMLCVDSNYVILNPEAIYDAFIKLHDDQTKISNNMTEAECKGSYTWLTGRFSKFEHYNILRKIIKKNLIDPNLKDWISNNVIKIPRGSNQRFSRKEKEIIRTKQKNHTRSGIFIPLEGLYNGDFEGDHLIPVASGGNTVISNGEIMTKKENRQKGSTSWEPYFDHQL